MKSLTIWCLMVILAYLQQDVIAKIQPYIWCGACIAMMEDMKIQIGAADKTETLQVGSFRILPDGTQQMKQVPYVTSELFLTEQLERICNAMYQYAETTAEKSSAKVIIRKSSYDGSSISMKNVHTSDELTRSLLYACNTIIEDNEDEIIAALKTYNEEKSKIETEICVNLTGLCTEDDVTTRMWAMANAVTAGIQEKADERLKESQAQEELDAELAAEAASNSAGADTPTDSMVLEEEEEELGEDITDKLVQEASVDQAKDEL